MRIWLLPALLSSAVLAVDPLANYNNYTFTAFVDNYGYDGRTFLMRYFVNTQYWTNGPILFYCGNEGAIEMFIESSGFLPIIADQLGALLVFAEHRYFGESLPFGSYSFANSNNRRYLSPHQALADYAYLLSFLLEEHPNSKVIVTGGSYGAMLAAWFRMKYPHLVDIAYAASAPIFHVPGVVDPEEYNQIISGDYAAVEQTCFNTIQYAFKRLQSLVSSATNYYQLTQVFETCEFVTASNANDIIEWVYNAFEYMAMTDYPYETNFLSPMPAWPVRAGCAEIAPVNLTSTDWQLAQALKNAANIYYNYSGELACNEIVQDYDSDLGQEGWDYLACSTLVLPIGANGVDDMFLPNPWNYNSYAQNCYQHYQRQPQPLYVQTFFGASTQSMNFSSLIYATNFIFTNGRLDPWYSGAVVEETSDGILAISMDQAAHHLDLRTPNNTADPDDVTNARNEIIGQLKSWAQAV